MATNILDMEDSQMAAVSKLKKWQKEYMENLFAPIAKTGIARFWSQVSPEMKQSMQATMPEQVKEMDKLYTRKVTPWRR